MIVAKSYYELILSHIFLRFNRNRPVGLIFFGEQQSSTDIEKLYSVFTLRTQIFAHYISH